MRGVALKKRGIFLFLLTATALVLGVVTSGCGLGAPQQDQARPLAISSDGGGSCATPQEGCACSDTGPVDCGETVHRDKNVVYCAIGTRPCKGGTYGACEVAEVVAREIPPDGPGKYSTLGLGSSQACVDNPCDPYCNTFIDNGSGLDAGSPLAVVDGGLTLQAGVSPSPSYNGLGITPATQAVVITKINPNAYPTTSPPSPIAFQAYFTPSNPPAYTPALWTVSDNDDAIISGAGKLTIVGNLPTVFAVNAKASGFSAQATVTVTVADTEVIGNPPAFSSPGGAADPDSVLYPYANTVFPRSLTPPVLQWSTGGVAASYVKACIRMRNAQNAVVFAWCQVMPEPNPQRFQFPSYAWKAFETAASGAPAEISLQRYTSQLNQEKVVPIRFSTQPMRGSIYFWEINNGSIARINPDGSLTQNFLQGSHSCNACHSVSADGTTLVAEADGGNGMGEAFDLRANKQIFQRPQWSSFWQAISPNGQWNLWNETPAILSPTSGNPFTGLLYSQYYLNGYYPGWGYVDYPAWSPAGGNWISYADRYYWNYSTGGGSWYVDLSHADLFLTQFHPPPTVTIDGTQFLPSSGPCAAVGEVAGAVSPAEYRIPTIQCTNGCGETCVAGGNLDYLFSTFGGKSYTVKFKVADYLHNCQNALSVNAYVDGSYIGSWTGAGTNQWQYPAFSFTAWKDQHVIRITQTDDYCCGCGCWGILDPSQCPSCGSPAGCSPWVGDLNLYVDEVSLIDMQETQWQDGLSYGASTGCAGNFGCGPATVPGWADAPPDAGGCGGTCTTGSWLAWWFPTIPGRNYTASFKTAGYLHNCANPLLVYMYAYPTNIGGWSNGQYLAGSWKWQFPQLTFTAYSTGTWVYILENNDACCGCSGTCNGACSPQFGDLNMYVDSVTLIKASGNEFFDESQTLIANNWFDGTQMTQINAYPTFTTDEARIVWEGGNTLRTRGNYGNLWITDRVNPTAFRARLNQANGVGYLQSYDLNVNYEPSFSPVRSGGYDWLAFVSNRSYGNILPPTASAKDQGVKQIWVSAINPAAPSGTDASAPAFWLPGQQTTNQNMRAFFAKSPCAQTGQLCEFSDDCCGYNAANPPASTARCLINQPYTNPVTRSCQAVQAFSCVAHGAACAQDTDCCTYPTDLCIQGLCKTPPPPPQYVPAVYTRDYLAACGPGTSPSWMLLKWKAYTPGDSSITFYAATADSLAGLPPASLQPVAPAVLLVTATNQSGSWAFTNIGSALPSGVSKNYLRVYDILNPTSDATQAPVLTDWQVTYDCTPSQ
jgi:hypothetical protein